MAMLDDTTRQKIIVDGDYATLVEEAKKIGNRLKAQKLSTSQIRGVFGTLRKIEFDWEEPKEGQSENIKSINAKREFLLLKPRIAYQAARIKESPNPVETLKNELIPLMDLVNESSATPMIQYNRFHYFLDFFEAIIAYHRAAGGSNN